MSKFEVCGVHEVEGSVESSPTSPTSRGCYLKALPRGFLFIVSLFKLLKKLPAYDLSHIRALSKLLVSPFLRPIVVPSITPYVAKTRSHM